MKNFLKGFAIPAVVGALVGLGISFLAMPKVSIARYWTTARDSGTLNALSTTSEACFPEDNGRKAWCIKNPAGNTIDVRFSLSGTVTTTTGIELQPGEFFCDGGGEHVYTGTVQCIAESGTPSVITLGY